MKSCSKCGIEKEEILFYKNTKQKDNLSTKCKSCDDLRIKEWNVTHVEQKKEYSRKAAKKYRDKNKNFPAFKYKKRLRAIRLKFGLSEEGLNELIKKQKNHCAICHDMFVKTPHVDHIIKDYKIVIRGLLCSNCNTAIGLLRDNPTIIRRAAKYVQDRGAE